MCFNHRCLGDEFWTLTPLMFGVVRLEAEDVVARLEAEDVVA